MAHNPCRFELSTVVVCLRPSSTACLPIHRSECATDSHGSIGGISTFFANSPTLTFKENYDVLVGQATVINYFRSKPGAPRTIMRYPGEMRLPGGKVETSDSGLSASACRELCEEFLIDYDLALSTVLHPIGAFQTRIVGGKSNMIVTFVALAEENAWLQDINLNARNTKLQAMAAAAEAQLDSGDWASLSSEARALLSPEFAELKWTKLSALVKTMQGSIAHPLQYVNHWQQKQFDLHEIQRRDPMSVSLGILIQAGRKAAAGFNKGNVVDVEMMIDEERKRFVEDLPSLCRARGTERPHL